MEPNRLNDGDDGTQNGPGEQIREHGGQAQQNQQDHQGREQGQDRQSERQGQSLQGGQQGKTASKERARGPDGNGQNAGGGVAELEIEQLGGIGEGPRGELGRWARSDRRRGGGDR
jgi:hypothetical protein